VIAVISDMSFEIVVINDMLIMLDDIVVVSLMIAVSDMLIVIAVINDMLDDEIFVSMIMIDTFFVLN
jgi:hypothetical protein